MPEAPEEIRCEASRLPSITAGAGEDFLPSRQFSPLAHVVFALASMAVVAAYAFILFAERRSPGSVLRRLESTAARGAAAPAASVSSTATAPAPEAKHDGPLLERGRSTPAGEWTDVPFSAERFSASAGARWVVQRDDVVSLATTVVGNTMTLSWFVTNSSVEGGPANYLRIAIPKAYRPVRRVIGTCAYSEGGGAWLTGMAEIDTVPPLLYIAKSGFPAAKWTAGSGIATAGQITFEVRERVSTRTR